MDGVDQLAAKLGLSREACATGVLEISAWNQANALRQVTVKRGLDVRDFTLTTFGGSGSLLLCRLMDILGIGTVLVPPDPGNVSAFGLLTVDVKNDYVQTHVALADALDPASVAEILDALTARAADALAKEGFAAADHRYARTADLRYFGQAFEVRVPVPDGPIDAAVLDEVAGRFHAEHKGLYGYDFADDASQQVEWVNLRVSGIGPIQRPEIKQHPVDDGFEARSASHLNQRSQARSASTRPRGTSTPRCCGGPTCPGRGRGGPGDHRGVRLDRAAAPGLHRPRSTTTSTSS